VPTHGDGDRRKHGLRKSIFEKYGPYRTDLNRINDLLGGEDTEYCWRLMHAGERLTYAPKAVVYHPVEEVSHQAKVFSIHGVHYGRWSISRRGSPGWREMLFWRSALLVPDCSAVSREVDVFLGEQIRSFYKLELFQTFGRMAESKKWLRNRQTQQQVQRLHPAK